MFCVFLWLGNVDDTLSWIDKTWGKKEKKNRGFPVVELCVPWRTSDDTIQSKRKFSVPFFFLLLISIRKVWLDPNQLVAFDRVRCVSFVKCVHKVCAVRVNLTYNDLGGLLVFFQNVLLLHSQSHPQAQHFSVRKLFFLQVLIFFFSDWY